MAGFEHNEGFDDHAAILIRCADHAAFGYGRMLEQAIFHLGAADVVACAHDHVVSPSLVEKVAILVLHEGIAWIVPAVFHVIGLPCIAQIFAAGGPHYGELADLAARQLIAMVVHHFGRIASDNLANRATPDLSACAGDEDMKHLGGANAIEHFNARGFFPELTRGIWQTFSRAHADAQAGHTFGLRKSSHLSIKRRCGVAKRGACAVDHIHHAFGCVSLVVKIHTRARPHWKQQQPA